MHTPACPCHPHKRRVALPADLGRGAPVAPATESTLVAPADAAYDSLLLSCIDRQRVLAEFKAEVATRYPSLRVEGLLMGLDGAITVLA